VTFGWPCLGCGRVNDLPMSVDAGIEDEAARATNYQIVSHNVELHGLCPLCRGYGYIENDSHLKTSLELKED